MLLISTGSPAVHSALYSWALLAMGSADVDVEQRNQVLQARGGASVCTAVTRCAHHDAATGYVCSSAVGVVAVGQAAGSRKCLTVGSS